jgi:hypothetical protein
MRRDWWSRPTAALHPIALAACRSKLGPGAHRGSPVLPGPVGRSGHGAAGGVHGVMDECRRGLAAGPEPDRLAVLLAGAAHPPHLAAPGWAVPPGPPGFGASGRSHWLLPSRAVAGFNCERPLTPPYEADTRTDRARSSTVMRTLWAPAGAQSNGPHAAYEPTPVSALSSRWPAGAGAVVARRSARSSSSIGGSMITTHTSWNPPNSHRAR